MRELIIAGSGLIKDLNYAMVLSLTVLLVVISGCYRPVEASPTPAELELTVTSDCYSFWIQRFPDYEWITLAEADLNADKRDDLLIIYRGIEGNCLMMAIVDVGSDFQTTAPVSAPVSDQVISIFDMDGEPPTEFSVSGRNGVNIGSAVFRLKDGKIEPLFSSGYGECC